jgi:hypothetical protein
MNWDNTLADAFRSRLKVLSEVGLACNPPPVGLPQLERSVSR